MTRVCSFCGGAGRQSKEHAVPQWFAKLKPETASVRVEGEHRNLRKWDIVTDEVDIKVGGCCIDCNTGWMSQLEDEAKPFLLPLLAGNEIELTPDSQETIATWAVKTCMVLEFSGAASRVKFFTQNEREALGRERRIPSSTAVFLAGYRGRHAFRASECPLVFSEAGHKFDGYSATMVFGALVLQVFTFRSSPGERVFQISGSFENTEIQIWPTRDVLIWPPEVVFDDDGIDDYSNRWVVKSGSEA